MSRAELSRALMIVAEAAARLAPRMTPTDLAELDNAGAALMEIAAAERQAAHAPHRLEKLKEIASGDGRRDREAAARDRA